MSSTTKPRTAPTSSVKHAHLTAQQQQCPSSPNKLDENLAPLPYRSRVARFFNPWIDLANVTAHDPTLLSFKIESVTRTFGVLGALMCSLSAAALAVTPSSDDEEEKDKASVPIIRVAKKDDEQSNDTIDSTLAGISCHDRNSTSTTNYKGLLEHDVAYTNHVAGTSLLVNHWGVPARTTHDLYISCCAASFYSSVCATGLSAVINAWLAATPLEGTPQFLRYHSLTICCIPGLLAVSTGMAGVALFIGLDRSKGTPISYIGLGGTILGGLMIGSATVRGLISTYRLLTPLVVKR